jgi:membrane fusion protein (multidrug efflux system)
MSARATLHWAPLFLAAAIAGCGSNDEPALISRPPVAVAPVEARRLVERILVTGELVAANEASVAAEVEGRVTSILVDEGSAVEKGATVFEIDTERRQLELDDTRAQVEVARANLEQQERDTKRWRSLRASKTASQAKLDAAESALRLARSRLASSQARLGLAERALRNASVAAPFSGTVARRYASEGEYIEAGADLFDLVSFDPIEVEFHVTERDSGRIELGQMLDVRVAPFPDEVFHARVSMISPRIDPRSRTLRIKARIEDHKARLRPGLFARADLGVSERAAVPMVPEAAILQRSDGSVAFRMVGPDRVERLVLETGTIRDGYVEVASGLDVGALIVVRGHAPLVDGSRVDVRTRAGKPAVASGPSAAERAE